MYMPDMRSLLPAKYNSLEEKTRFEILGISWYPTFFTAETHCYPAKSEYVPLLKPSSWSNPPFFPVKSTIFPGQIQIFCVNHSSNPKRFNSRSTASLETVMGSWILPKSSNFMEMWRYDGL
jgi:hypothetical protein